ncbi:peptidylprolyl isomerase [Devosia sp. WQ 349]|uniref:peptidylprolyl isomerase n=1 Tax=Devosia sp. WQ 349K1 TaxID=2800329 RepID=UPI0019058414|nr:peptidylprolyl isomerase [Devosia sp. WQ 349K1]MBK1792986.1 peptidylprolyl isomerase [Devosia sp. WQ 349K1]
MIKVRVETEQGNFTLGLEPERAPITTENFLAYVDGGHLDAARAYRVVTLSNQAPERDPKIEVVQMGIDPKDDQPQIFPPIAHEPTSVTGIKHQHMTVSMARLEPGTATSEFFICIGDQPELDFGGRRNPDGQGFAAFGKVIEGEDIVMKIFATAESTEYPQSPVSAQKFTRV